MKRVSSEEVTHQSGEEDDEMKERHKIDFCREQPLTDLVTGNVETSTRDQCSNVG